MWNNALWELYVYGYITLFININITESVLSVGSGKQRQKKNVRQTAFYRGLPRHLLGILITHLTP
jgi:hypothetical protein